jgi:hypothetical protein
LDKAAIVTEEEAKDSNAPPNLWNLVTVHRVEELKAIIRMHPIWASGILLIMSSSHLGSLVTVTRAFFFLVIFTVLSSLEGASLKLLMCTLVVLSCLSHYHIFIYQ